MNRGIRLLLSLGLLLISAHRLPAPISEIPSATPAPEQSARPKPKPASKSKPTTKQDRLETSQPTNQLAASPKTFEGTWRGTLKLGAFGANDYTLHINALGTVVTEQSSRTNPATYQAVPDGRTTKWRGSVGETWTFTPSPDGNTALVTSINKPKSWWLTDWDTSATFSKTSP